MLAWTRIDSLHRPSAGEGSDGDRVAQVGAERDRASEEKNGAEPS